MWYAVRNSPRICAYSSTVSVLSATSVCTYAYSVDSQIRLRMQRDNSTSFVVKEKSCMRHNSIRAIWGDKARQMSLSPFVQAAVDAGREWRSAKSSLVR